MPLAIIFGMPVKEFWEEEPDLLWVYRKAYMDKFNIQRELMNQQAWLNGLYVYDAIGVALSNAFAKKGAIPQSYIQEPIKFNITKEEIERQKRIELENNIRQSLNRKKELLKGR